MARGRLRDRPKKFLGGEQPAGLMHAVIFWGFLVLMLQVITLFVRAFDAD